MSEVAAGRARRESELIMATTTAEPATSTPATVNEIHLVGRVSAIADERDLPSGDTVRTFRLVVSRLAKRGRKGAVDVIEVACWTAATRRTIDRVGLGAMAEVTGSLHRRFFRTPGGPASRYEVEARTIRRAKQEVPPT